MTRFPIVSIGMGVSSLILLAVLVMLLPRDFTTFEGALLIVLIMGCESISAAIELSSGDKVGTN